MMGEAYKLLVTTSFLNEESVFAVPRGRVVIQLSDPITISNLTIVVFMISRGRIASFVHRKENYSDWKNIFEVIK